VEKVNWVEAFPDITILGGAFISRSTSDTGRVLEPTDESFLKHP
jgi:hypothetical protein